MFKLAIESHSIRNYLLIYEWKLEKSDIDKKIKISNEKLYGK